MKISTRFTFANKITLLVFFLVFSFQDVFSQTISATDGTSPCQNCAPPGWTDNGGTPDVSSSTVAAAAGVGGGGATWDFPSNGDVLPLPPNGHADWISLRDINSTEETVITTMSGLVVGQTYELILYWFAPVSNNDGQGPDYYAGTFIEDFDYQIGTNPRQTIVVDVADRNQWITEAIRFTATATSMDFSFFPGNDSTPRGGGSRIVYETIQLSITLNAINNAPIADNNSDSTPINTATTFNVVSTDVDPDGNIIDSTVDLDLSTPGIQTSISTPEGTWAVDAFGNVTFTPMTGFTGIATLDYTVQDDYVLDGLPQPATSNIATLSVEIIDITAEDDDFSATSFNPVTGGTTLSVFADNGNTEDDANGSNATDANIDDNISISNDGGLTGVTINTDGTITIPADSTPGTYTVEYTICLDVNNLICGTANVSIVVGNCLDFPTNDCDNDGVLNASDICEGFNDLADVDGDSVPDGCDLDDDNDGLLDSVECNATNALINGDFVSNLVTGWTESGDLDWFRSGIGGGIVRFIEDDSDSTFEQTVTVYPNVITAFTFQDAADAVSAVGTTLEISIDGIIVYSKTADQIQSDNGGVNTFATQSLFFVSTTGTAVISIRAFSDGPGVSDDLRLDNITVELCQDLDGGGTPDFLDSDSDNDGCPDALEGDGGFILTDLDFEDSLGDIVDADGIPIVGGSSGLQNDISSLDPNVNSVECDDDGDGVSNFNDQCPGFDDTQNNDGDLYADGCDDDDDNDGILDVIEQGYTTNSQPICGGQTTLDFSNIPIELVGNGGASVVEGEVHRFPNVAPGIDAIVTINEIHNCLIFAMDDNSSDPTFFKPEIRTGNIPAGQRPFVEYEFQFVQTGTMDLFIIPELFINFNDLDGSPEILEQNWTEYPDSYTLDSPSDITITDESPWIVGTSSDQNYPGTSNTNPLINYSTRYLNTSSQTIRLGLLSTVANSPVARRYSVEFNCVNNFNNPITTLFDIDKDGIPNHLDPDSDNDGCYDVVESGGIDDNNDGVLDGTGLDSNGLIAGGVGGYDGVNGTEIISDVVSNITITPNPDPATVCELEDLVLTATITGIRVTDFGLTGSTSDDTTIAIPAVDFSYQWYLGATALTDGAQYSGTQTAILTINSVPASFDTNIYRLEVTTVNNSCPAEESISITVNSVTASTVSATDASVCSGEDGEFVITGDAGDTVTYSIDGGTSVTAVIPADGTLEIAVLGITANTTIDVSNVANASCDIDLTGVTATITVEASPTASTVSATDASVCSGEDGEFVITGDAGDTVTYSIDGGTSVTVVIPADGTLEIAVLGITANTTIDVSNVANASCDIDLTGVTATITVEASPTASTVSATDASVCSGEDGEFVITGDAGDTVTYSIDGGTSVTAVIPADGTLEIAVLGITANTTIDVSNVANASCDIDLTGVTATITVDALPNAGTDGNVEICVDEELTQTEIFAELGGTPDGGGVWTDDMSNAVVFPITEAGIYLYTVTGNGACVSVSDVATVTVTECPLPLIEVIKTATVNDNGDAVIGVGDVINYTITVENIGNLILDNVNIVSDVLTDLNGNSLTFDSPPTFFGPTSSMGSIEGDLLVGETATYQASYTITQSDVDAGGVSNIAVASGDGPGGGTVSDQSDDPTDPTDIDLNGNGDPDDPTIIETDSEFELSVFKEVDVLEPLIGDNVTFTITVSNEGFVTATGVIVEDVLPSGYAFVEAITTAGAYSDMTGEWIVGQLNPGQVEILQITVEVLGFGDYLNTALISNLIGGTDMNLNNNESSASVDPICLTIYNEFSPNGDGVNDTFMIDCIETFPNNTLEIYNRWGNIVYSKKGYRNDWNGTSNGRVVVAETNQLPVGTYYYVIDLGDGSEPRVGWLYINR